MCFQPSGPAEERMMLKCYLSEAKAEKREALKQLASAERYIKNVEKELAKLAAKPKKKVKK